jgi:hypothetical protein
MTLGGRKAFMKNCQELHFSSQFPMYFIKELTVLATPLVPKGAESWNYGKGLPALSKIHYLSNLVSITLKKKCIVYRYTSGSIYRYDKSTSVTNQRFSATLHIYVHVPSLSPSWGQNLNPWDNEIYILVQL